MRTFLTLGFTFLCARALAQDKPDLSGSTQRMSYALGMEAGRVLKLDNFNIDMNAILAGMHDTEAGHPALTYQEQKAAMKQMRSDILAKAVAKKEAEGVLHKAEGDAFLAANAKKEGVLIAETIAPNGSKAELQYKILSSGPPGASPSMSDTVVVRYRGTFIDGTEFDIFDPSMKQGDTITMKMTDAIPGWVTALQKMHVGDKWQLFVPPSLGYADYGPPPVDMYRTLIYEIELVKFYPTSSAPVSAANIQ